MAREKIFNDPVYGFINIPYGVIFDLIEHPYFQRLRRIKQVSLSHYVYPGALHTRFHHALGALHLMTQAIGVLRGKGVDITEEEATAASIAILLHDIGHGPFSHTLEHTLIAVPHERLSELFMEALDEEFGGALHLALAIFKDRYPKKFLHQLVSGQLDMDRMDYLSRDSFFTGVHEGVIGYDRIIKMLAVYDNELVVEEKGIYSIEKFLIARRLMYWQVYLHKTVVSAEQMLIQVLRRARHLALAGVELPCPPNLWYFIQHEVCEADFEKDGNRLLAYFASLDDYDVFSAVKSWINAEDRCLSYLSYGMIHRKLFKLEFSAQPFSETYISSLRERLATWWGGVDGDLDYLLVEGRERNSAYDIDKDEIKILFKNGAVGPMSKSEDFEVRARPVEKYYVWYPKELKK